MANRVNTYTPALFNKDDYPKWSEYFQENGYVVLKDILTEQDKLHAFSLFAIDWKTVSPRFDFHNKLTWSPSNSPMMWNKGMIYWNGLGQYSILDFYLCATTILVFDCCSRIRKIHRNL